MSEREAIVTAWEEQLRKGCAGPLRDFWQSLDCAGNSEECGQLFFELAALELEFAWKRAAEQPVAERIRAAAYVHLLGEQCDSSLQIRLFAEEYYVRLRFGDRPSREAFVATADCDHVRLHQALDQVERQWREEFAWQRPAAPPAIIVPAYDPRAPLSLADYLVQKFLGAGTVGRVYRARQHSLQRTVALKFLRKHFVANAVVVDRFLQEARLAGSLRHPGIVGIHGLGRTPAGAYFIAMDWIDGEPLRPIDVRQPVQIRRLLEALAQAAEAMSVAHSAGIVHCDLKPANLLCDRYGTVVITDFGLARQWTAEEATWSVGEGTPVCIAPEQVADCWGAVGPATDVFNLTATLFLLLTGRSPHGRGSAADLLASAVSGRPVAPLPESTNIPSQLAELCAAGLIKSPDRRALSIQQWAGAARSIAAKCK